MIDESAVRYYNSWVREGNDWVRVLPNISDSPKWQPATAALGSHAQTLIYSIITRCL